MGSGQMTATTFETYLVGQLVHLLCREAGVGKHANLVGDMTPVVLGSKIFKVLLQERPHCDYAFSHTFDLTKPLLIKRWIIKDFRGNAGTMNRRVRIKRADKDLYLRVDTLLLIDIGADD